ncbi:MAG TPA: indolepyruvate oxidoreductase subunit beta [Myxococcales bacterium]|nr:indolepyruvate oxidoreductase subunit beta [Myxococcales bacterium]
MAKVTNVVVAGLGGQGAIKASDILADAAFRSGFDVKKAEIHGMSQRGGSVSSDVRFGDKVLSPMVPAGEADFLLVLSPSEVEVNRPALRQGGLVIPPDFIDPAALPNKRSLNVALLGALSHCLALPESAWIEALDAALPERLAGLNHKAFELGRATARARGLPTAAREEERS